MIKKFKSYISSIWEEKKYLMIALWSVIAIIALVATIELTEMLISFIAEKFDLLIFLGTICFVSYFYLKYKKEEQIARISKVNQNKEVIEKELHENNFICIRKCIFQILDNDISDVLGLKKPIRLSELDSPGKIVVKGNVFLYQFVVLKKSNEVDCNRIKEVLQKEVNEALDNFRLEGIRQTKFIANGVAFPILNVDSVKDMGNYIQLELVWASQDYVDLIETRKNILAEKLNKDNSFDDDDF
jgi:hypothetical protein